ncbi:MAG: EutN/CcmL family microcompartment protein [Oligoflexia bacterium]|nr:EutN/CcmL family microcompartment protein [Oligoflexia bacterium]
MRIAKVIGTVVATIKDRRLLGEKLLLIQPLNEELKNSGELLVAIDSVSAGPNDLVIYTLSREAALAAYDPDAPVDAAITGIIDEVNHETR